MAETGHARNIERFAQLIAFVQGYGAEYAPSNAAITLAALQAKLTAARAQVDGVRDALGSWKVAINDRQNAFDDIRKLTTRVVNSFDSSGAPRNAVEDAKSFKRKVDGARATALPVDNPDTPEDESKGNSASQRSYTQLIEHFENLLALLDSTGTYAPNEPELQLAALQTYSTSLRNANNTVINATTSLSNSRINRDEALYGDDAGIVELAALVKKYVKSLYGADSPQYQQVSGLQFKRVP